MEPVLTNNAMELDFKTGQLTESGAKLVKKSKFLSSAWFR